MNKTGLQTYPNIRGHAIGDNKRGGVRVGVVIENEDTKLVGTAGFPAMVTREERGRIWYYTFTVMPDDSPFRGIPMWKGPYVGLSEEIEEMTS